MIRPTPAESLALLMLARDGIAAIWQLHLAAAEAHRTGHRSAAVSISEIAEAAEQAWLRAEGSRATVAIEAALTGRNQPPRKSPYCRSAYRIARSRAFGSAKVATSQPLSSSNHSVRHSSRDPRSVGCGVVPFGQCRLCSLAFDAVEPLLLQTMVDPLA
jgi:hypothetical protein